MAVSSSLVPMGIREKLRDKPSLAIMCAAVFVVLAVGIAIYTHWPDKQPNPLHAYYSDDDGKTWFTDSIYQVPPFDHNGKPAVFAQIYTYDDGKKQFCGYLSRYTPEAKQRLDAALADAQKRGAAPGSIALYQDRNFMSRSTQLKVPGANQPWMTNEEAQEKGIFSIHSPDGSAVDLYIVY
jgi:hypothetical protein